MREDFKHLDCFRKRHPVGGMTLPGAGHGYFEVDGLRIISSGPNSETIWEHVSVSLPNRCPRWEEMQAVKRAFWKDSETVIQFHPSQSQYKNDHPYCLHLWRHPNIEVVLPPIDLV